MEQPPRHRRSAATPAAAPIPNLRVGNIYTRESITISMHINILLAIQVVGSRRSGGFGVDDFDTTLRNAPIDPPFCHIGRRPSVAWGALRRSCSPSQIQDVTSHPALRALARGLLISRQSGRRPGKEGIGGSP